jgi:ketopantoate reductase
MADKRIYMIGGVGSVGKLIAHSIRDLQDPPPVTLLVHTPQLLEQWKHGKQVITLRRDGKELVSKGYDVELMAEYKKPDPEEHKHAISNEPIHHLLVITKAAYTVPNLIRVAHRLTRDSTVCFLQNGMGILEEVREKIFPDPSTAPHFMQGMKSPTEKYSKYCVSTLT